MSSSFAELAAGAATLWSEALMSFPYWEVRSRPQWDRAFEDVLDRLTQLESTDAYYALLSSFAAALEDPHTQVIYPNEHLLALGRPDVRVCWVEDRALVRSGEDLPIGSTLMAIDDTPIDRVLSEKSRYISGSAIRYRFTMAAEQLLWGQKGSAVRVLTDQGLTKTLIRRFPVTSGEGVCQVTEPNKGIHVVRIRRWCKEAVASLVSSIPDWSSVRAMVIDLRLCRGGDAASAVNFVRQLVDCPVRSPGWRSMQSVPYWRALGWPQTWVTQRSSILVPDTQRLGPFVGPVAALVSCLTLSAAEQFVWILKQSPHAKLFGERTGGGTGVPYTFALPCGGFGTVSTRACDENELELGRGVEPDEVIPETAESVRASNDIVLERALSWAVEAGA